MLVLFFHVDRVPQYVGAMDGSEGHTLLRDVEGPFRASPLVLCLVLLYLLLPLFPEQVRMVHGKGGVLADGDVRHAGHLKETENGLKMNARFFF
jgi:hypothetical protein